MHVSTHSIGFTTSQLPKTITSQPEGKLVWEFWLINYEALNHNNKCWQTKQMQLILYRTKRIPKTQLCLRSLSWQKGNWMHAERVARIGCIRIHCCTRCKPTWLQDQCTAPTGCKPNALLNKDYRYMAARRIHCSHWLQADMAASLIT